MPQTKVIIVYSPNQNKRRMVIKPHDDSHIDHHAKNIAPGEAVHIVDMSDYDTIGPDEMLVRHTGRQPSSDRCVVVDADGNVIHGLKADPLIDKHPHGVIHQHDESHPGWKHINERWIEPEPAIQKLPVEEDIIFDNGKTVVPSGLYNSTWEDIGDITIKENILSIGCEVHTIDEWKSFKDSRIALMSPNALIWWKQHKNIVMDLAQKHLEKVKL